jgi:chromosome segregation ATPase
MEFEQITKRLEWLDDEHRKNKTAISDLNEKLTALEASITVLNKQIKSISKEFSDLGTAAARLNQFDQIMTKQRTDLTNLVETIEKRAHHREQESSKLTRTELTEIKSSILKLSSVLNRDDIDKRFKDQAHEEQRLNVALQDMQAKVDESLQKSGELLVVQKPMEEARRLDAKRINDLQGELASLRKRTDEAREKTTLHSDSIRNLDNRLTELVETETGRKDAQIAFLQEQALSQVDRDRAWKDWQEKYEFFKKQAENMEVQVAALDDTIRAAKRAQDVYNDVNQKLERRTSEVSEMQRLAEDRVRQEWVAFKADEQKRWTSHSLTQEESMRDLRKDMDKLERRVTSHDDTTQTLQDQLHQTTDTTEKQLQELMNLANDWLTAYERIMGHTKTKAKKSTR